ncbi:substrate-binding domain-containing protein [Streptomyces sp. NBC_01614]|uniref:substrate-binding domain-containing protein n=1 Tax=Streptomyces sp. NBC_01614 TaxID=2975897 RepID=UPI0038665190
MTNILSDESVLVVADLPRTVGSEIPVQDFAGRRHPVDSINFRTVGAGGRTGRPLVPVLVIALLLALTSCSQGGQARPGDSPTTGTGALDPVVQEAKRAVAAASRTGPSRWTGPVTGPAAVSGRRLVIYVSETLANGGVTGSMEGAREAAKVIGWDFRLIDGGGTPSGITAALQKAIDQKPDGIILGAFDAQGEAPLLAQASSKGITVVGWHSGDNPGPLTDPAVFYNVGTDTTKVAQLAAQFAIARSNGHTGTVIFTDDSIPIAHSKAQIMQDTIESCKECSVLSYVSIPLGAAVERTPQKVNHLLSRFGSRWTDSVAINDLYYDGAVSSLRKARKPPAGPPFNTSGGDGSVPAFKRIRAGEYQTATIPEPLHEQGWQLIDELNRAFAGSPPSYYIAPLHVVTKKNIGSGNVYEPPNGYRDHYRAVWQR